MADITDSLIDTIVARIRGGKRIRRSVGAGGRLHIESPVPFLCVHRLPPERADPGTSRLVAGEGSYLVAAGGEEAFPGLRKLVAAIAQALSEEFKAVLLIELWSGLAAEGAPGGGALTTRPCFRIEMPDDGAARVPAAMLARELRNVRIAGRRAGVKVLPRAMPSPPGMSPLLAPDDVRRSGALTLGLEVPPVYQDAIGGGVYPRVLRQLHREISGALRQASFRFAHLQTSHRPEHFLTMGQRVMLRAAREADHQLAAVSDEFDLLLAVTPVNAAEAEAEFRARRFRRSPRFLYRLLNFDPDVLKRRLYGIALELVEDPALGELMRDKRDELDRQITLLHDRSTERFLYGSLQLYGGLDDATLALARQVLSAPRRGGMEGGGRRRASDPNDGQVDAAAFARRALEEIARYRQVWPDLPATVELRDDVPGLLVTRGQLLISQSLRIPAARLEPLIHHEIGTHVLTWHNAAAQPLKLLASGLPGYEELQEGTAVMAEYLVGGLQPARLRLLAGRVMAVHRAVEGRKFREVFAELCDGYGFGPHVAFTTAMRVFRGGGFTKDAIYLRGLARLLAYLAGGGELELLFLGKVSEQSLPVVRELRWRGVLRTPPLRPGFLDVPGAAERLERLRSGASIHDLIEESLDPP